MRHRRVAGGLLCVVLAFACAARYPARWWTPVASDGAPAWEILPQEAKPGEVILSKRNELGLLSNFAPTPFTYRGRRYASLEGFWQMMLYPEGTDDPRAIHPGVVWTHTRGDVAQMTAFVAKDAGTLAEENMRKMGIGWVSFEGSASNTGPPFPGSTTSHRRGDAREGRTESEREEGAAGDRKSHARARSCPGAGRARGVALLRNPDDDSLRAAKEMNR